MEMLARTSSLLPAALALGFAAAPALAQTASIDLGSPDARAGLRNTQRGDGTDGENDPGICGPAEDLRSGRTTRGAADDDVADAYMYFLVEDPAVKGSPRLRIRAAFYDDPSFAADPVAVRLEYTNARSTGPHDIANTFARHRRAWILSGSGRWVRHAWSIADAGFRTFMQGSSDFRFSVGRRRVCIARVEASVAPAPRDPEEPLVGVHYYPWYTRDRWNYRECVAGALRLELVPAQAPALGRYDSSTPSVVDRHIRWCAESGIAVIILEYIAPGGREDRVCREAILPHARSGDVRFAIMYDWAIRFGGEFEITAERIATAAADFDHLAREYFPHPSYLEVEGRPVVLIYVTRVLRGDVEALIGVLRDACGARGWDLFLAGDEFFFPSSPRAEKIARWDGIFGYDCYAGRGGYWETNGTLELFRRRTEEYRAAAEAAGVAFFPSILPGFNDRAVRRTCADNPALPRALAAGRPHASLFRKLLVEVALPRLDPELPLLAVTSFNEWHEDTQIEPTAGGGPATSTDASPSGTQYVQGYAYEDYGTAFLDVVRDAVLAVTGRVLDARGPVPGALVEVLRGEEVVLARRSFSTGAYAIPRLRLEPSVSYRLRARSGDAEGLSPAFAILPDRARTDLDILIAKAPPPVLFRRGDANADGRVDIADAIYLLGHIFGLGPGLACEAAADANDDDAIDIADAISILSYLFSGAPMPAPGACGADPTPGGIGCARYIPCEP